MFLSSIQRSYLAMFQMYAPEANDQERKFSLSVKDHVLFETMIGAEKAVKITGHCVAR